MSRRSARPSRNPSSSSTTRMRRLGAPILEPLDFTCRVSYAGGNPCPRCQGSPCLAGLLPVHRRAVLASAEVVELVDTPDSGSGGGNPVEVRVLSAAPRLDGT